MNQLIAVDWGSSALRAYLLDHRQQIVDRVEADKGVLQHQGQGFAESLRGVCGEWLEHWPQIPVIMAGMIGSRNGWQEAPYIPCPADVGQLATQMLAIHDGSITNPLFIVPGVSGSSPSGETDVMRGEEVQLLGALKNASEDSALICLPGTHSKWVQVKDGVIEYFSTFMTGELYSLLKQHSSIGSLIQTEHTSDSDFLDGVAYSRKPGDLSHHLFAVRASFLTGGRAENALASFLSGLVIGHEFRGCADLYPSSQLTLLIGSPRLQHVYQLAGQVFDRPLKTIDPQQAFVSGILALLERQLTVTC